MSDKSYMAILNESPPYMPIAYVDREIWALLVGLGYYHVKLIKYEKGVQVVFTHKPWLKSEGSNVEKCEVIDLRWAGCFGRVAQPFLHPVHTSPF